MTLSPTYQSPSPFFLYNHRQPPQHQDNPSHHSPSSSKYPPPSPAQNNLGLTMPTQKPLPCKSIHKTTFPLLIQHKTNNHHFHLSNFPDSTSRISSAMPYASNTHLSRTKPARRYPTFSISFSITITVFSIAPFHSLSYPYYTPISCRTPLLPLRSF